MIIYSSVDAGAPVVTNTNNSLNALLYATLVTGYGSKPGAGWTRPFTGTNLAAYRQGVGGQGRHLRVFDGGFDGHSSRRVSLRGYEVMSAISTGTGPFPTTGQVSGNGASFPYYAYGGALAPTWVLFADATFFMLWMDINPPNKYYEMMMFGSFYSFKPGDIYNQVLVASAQNYGGWQGTLASPGATAAAQNGMWVARNDLGVLGAKDAHLVSETLQGLTSYIGQGHSSFPYPDRPTTALLQSQPVLWCDGYRRGRIPGLWELPHFPTSVGGDGTTWSGASGPLAGKTFKLIGPLSPAVNGAAWPVIETSDTWS